MALPSGCTLGVHGVLGGNGSSLWPPSCDTHPVPYPCRLLLWSVMDFKGLKTTLDRHLMKGQLVYKGRVGSTGGRGLQGVDF